MPIPDAPYLVTLGFDPPTFERLDRLRVRYFPPERNIVPAHLSLFHQLPGEEGDEIARVLADLARTIPPVPLTFPGVKRTGRGVMAVVEAPGLSTIRSSLARSFSGWLTPQDRQPFRPHVTIMNKAEPAEAAQAFEELRATWSPFPGLGDRLILWRYLGGPWDEVDALDLHAQPEVVGSHPHTSDPEG